MAGVANDVSTAAVWRDNAVQEHLHQRQHHLPPHWRHRHGALGALVCKRHPAECCLQSPHAGKLQNPPAPPGTIPPLLPPHHPFPECYGACAFFSVILFRLISLRFVSSRLISFRFVLFCFVLFLFFSFRFASLRFAIL